MNTGAQIASNYARGLRSLGREDEARQFVLDFNATIAGQYADPQDRQNAVEKLIRDQNSGLAR